MANCREWYGLVNFCYQKTQTPKALKKAFGLGLAMAMYFRLPGRKPSWGGLLGIPQGLAEVLFPVPERRKWK